MKIIQGNLIRVIYQFCLFITISSLILIISEDFINGFGFLIQFGLILVTGIGGVAIYIVIGYKFEEVWMRLMKKNN